MNSYCLKVTSAEGNEVAMSPCTSGDGHVHLLVEDLNENLSFNFTIVSSNSIGEQSTTFSKTYYTEVPNEDIVISFNSIVYIVIINALYLMYTHTHTY